MGLADQPSLFGPDYEQEPAKPPGELPEEMRVLITVKAAPNPSETYGETVCVAGLRLDVDRPGWVRLYPINYRELETNQKFKKYDIVSLQARPNHSDPRPESFRPLLNTVRREGHLKPWKPREPYVVDHLYESMCALLTGVRTNPPGKSRSLAAIRPRVVQGIDIEPHPGWTAEEQAKIDNYVNKLDLFERAPRTALEAPRFKGWYRYLCHSASCKGHRQGIIDWEWVALQRKLPGYDDQRLQAALRKKFLDEICGADRDVIFYLGNQAKRMRTFMVLGMYYAKRS
ncbi:hypothetical protein OG417_21290 [Actinoallomurus sp. NBC_01490]|uniref:hypothetical protein n=1 Tax=Actinoallomurus sp. NBC_01490 TaxID=2903557 RepID=UPI002E326D42|nr:hypothetical protein [Actinoallomurus sp. NBC_01490]